MISACNAGTVRFRDLAGIPRRWSIDPLSPITREERERGVSAVYLLARPVMPLIAGVVGLAYLSINKRQVPAP